MTDIRAESSVVETDLILYLVLILGILPFFTGLDRLVDLGDLDIIETLHGKGGLRLVIGVVIVREQCVIGVSISRNDCIDRLSQDSGGGAVASDALIRQLLDARTLSRLFLTYRLPDSFHLQSDSA